MKRYLIMSVCNDEVVAVSDSLDLVQKYLDQNGPGELSYCEVDLEKFPLARKALEPDDFDKRNKITRMTLGTYTDGVSDYDLVVTPLEDDAIASVDMEHSDTLLVDFPDVIDSIIELADDLGLTETEKTLMSGMENSANLLETIAQDGFDWSNKSSIIWDMEKIYNEARNNMASED